MFKTSHVILLHLIIRYFKLLIKFLDLFDSGGIIRYIWLKFWAIFQECLTCPNRRHWSWIFLDFQIYINLRQFYATLGLFKIANHNRPYVILTNRLFELSGTNFLAYHLWKVFHIFIFHACFHPMVEIFVIWKPFSLWIVKKFFYDKNKIKDISLFFWQFLVIKWCETHAFVEVTKKRCPYPELRFIEKFSRLNIIRVMKILPNSINYGRYNRIDPISHTIVRFCDHFYIFEMIYCSIYFSDWLLSHINIIRDWLLSFRWLLWWHILINWW